MFSGIVEEAASVTAITRTGGGARLVVESGLDHAATAIGDSIAVNGCCLTVVALEQGSKWNVAFELAEETLRRTTLGGLTTGDAVNLERSVGLGARMHGHLVTGHVDAVVKLLERRPEGESVRLEWELPSRYRPFVAEKGSVALAGVSLTVGEVAQDRFAVYVIPHTSAVTILGRIRAGQTVNFEVDLFARYVVNALRVAGTIPAEGISEAMLREHGFTRDGE